MLLLIVWTLLLSILTIIYFVVAYTYKPQQLSTSPSSDYVRTCLGGYQVPLNHSFSDDMVKVIDLLYSYPNELNIFIKYTIKNSTLYIVDDLLILISSESNPNYSLKDFKTFKDVDLSIPSDGVIELYSEGRENYFMTIVDPYMDNITKVYCVGTYAAIPTIFIISKYQKSCDMYSVYPVFQGTPTSLITCHVQEGTDENASTIYPGSVQEYSSGVCEDYANTFYAYAVSF